MYFEIQYVSYITEHDLNYERMNMYRIFVQMNIYYTRVWCSTRSARNGASDHNSTLASADQKSEWNEFKLEKAS